MVTYFLGNTIGIGELFFEFNLYIWYGYLEKFLLKGQYFLTKSRILIEYWQSHCKNISMIREKAWGES
ncbi:hypothetical protein EVI01_06660 [Enterococcus villorum]|uniref:Uncharacterized protein n=1 Tax=Enterococcus villorum TaxID=112904 RepID=A0A511J0Z4_9ENTE|nr:hypothetical protein EVI01_06660 [Enterococcus villorum]